MIEQELNKACEWLEFNAGGYLGLVHEESIVGATLHTAKMIKDFRKAMGAVVKESLTTELTWQDVQKIVEIADKMLQTAHDRVKWEDKSEEDYYTKILIRFKEIKEEKK